MKGLEPKIELINTEGKADGLADWTTGTIQINEYTSNAKKIVDSFPMDAKIIFGPDKNLGGYINAVTGRNMILWN